MQATLQIYCIERIQYIPYEGNQGLQANQIRISRSYTDFIPTTNTVTISLTIFQPRKTKMKKLSKIRNVCNSK